MAKIREFKERKFKEQEPPLVGEFPEQEVTAKMSEAVSKNVPLTEFQKKYVRGLPQTSIKNTSRSDAYYDALSKVEKTDKGMKAIDDILSGNINVGFNAPLALAKGSYEGFKSAINKAEEAGQAFRKGDITGGILSTLAAQGRGVFSALAVATPAIQIFNQATQTTANIPIGVVQEAVEIATQPFSKILKPESLAGQSAAELGDTAWNIIAAGAIGKYAGRNKPQPKVERPIDIPIEKPKLLGEPKGGKFEGTESGVARPDLIESAKEIGGLEQQKSQVNSQIRELREELKTADKGRKKTILREMSALNKEFNKLDTDIISKQNALEINRKTTPYEDPNKLLPQYAERTPVESIEGNTPSNVNFTKAVSEDLVDRAFGKGKRYQGNLPPEKATPVMRGIRDYLKDRTLRLFEIESKKPLDPTVLSAIMDFAKKNNIESETYAILRTEAMKRNKLSEFETAFEEVNKPKAKPVEDVEYKETNELLTEGEKEIPKTEPTAIDNNKSAAIDLFAKGKNTNDVLKALGLRRTKENLAQAKLWKEESQKSAIPEENVQSLPKTENIEQNVPETKDTPLKPTEKEAIKVIEETKTEPIKDRLEKTTELKDKVDEPETFRLNEGLGNYIKERAFVGNNIDNLLTEFSNYKDNVKEYVSTLRLGRDVEFNIGNFKAKLENPTYQTLSQLKTNASKTEEGLLGQGLRQALKDKRVPIAIPELGVNPKGKIDIDAVNEAKVNIIKKTLGRANLGIDPTIIKDYAVVGKYHLDNIINSGIEKSQQFYDLTKRMVSEFGDGVKQFMLKIWQEVKSYATGEKAFLDPNTVNMFGGKGGKEFNQKRTQANLDATLDFTAKLKQSNPKMGFNDFTNEYKKRFPNVAQENVSKVYNLYKAIPDNLYEVSQQVGQKVKEGNVRKLYNNVVKQSSNYIKTMGEGGKKIIEKTNIMTERERQLMGNPSRAIFDVMGLSKDELANLTEIEKAKMFGKEAPKPINQKVSDVIQEVDNIYSEFGTKAEQMNFQIEDASGKKRPFKQINNYRPRNLNFDITDMLVEKNSNGEIMANARRQKLLDDMVKSKKAQNIADAAYKLDTYIAKARERKASHLEYSRVLDLPEQYYETNPMKNLLRYSQDASKRISYVEQFGFEAIEGSKVANELLSQIQKDGYDSNQARKFLRYETGQLTTKEHEILRNVNAIKGFMVLTKFSPFTTLRNSLQGFTGSAVRTNLKSAMRAQITFFSRQVKRNAYESGALADHLEKIINSDLGGGGKITGSYLDVIGFTATDGANRIVGATAGELFYKDMLKRIQKDSVLKRRAFREFEKMGLNAEEVSKRGDFTTEELNKIRRSIAGETQFNVRASDLPLFWSSGMGKLVTQWKSFGYKMTQLLRDSILKELKAGNPAPLATGLGVYLVGGELVNTAIDLTRENAKGIMAGEGLSAKKTKEESLLYKISEGDIGEVGERIVYDLAGLGALTVLVDVVRSFGYRKSNPAVSLVAGPAISEATQTIQDVVGPIGQIANFKSKDFLTKEAQGITTATSRQLPGYGALRTLGVTKYIDELFKEGDSTRPGFQKREFKKREFKRREFR